MNKKNDILWFLVEVKLMANDKIHIEKVICRIYDIHYGLDYIYNNKKILNDNRLIAIIKENGDTWICKKDETEDIGFRYILKCANLETDYDNCEILFPYCDEYIEYGQEHGIIYHEYL